MSLSISRPSSFLLYSLSSLFHVSASLRQGADRYIYINIFAPLWYARASEEGNGVRSDVFRRSVVVVVYRGASEKNVAPTPASLWSSPSAFIPPPSSSSSVWCHLGSSISFSRLFVSSGSSLIYPIYFVKGRKRDDAKRFMANHRCLKYGGRPKGNN